MLFREPLCGKLSHRKKREKSLFVCAVACWLWEIREISPLETLWNLLEVFLSRKWFEVFTEFICSLNANRMLHRQD